MTYRVEEFLKRPSLAVIGCLAFTLAGCAAASSGSAANVSNASAVSTGTPNARGAARPALPSAAAKDPSAVAKDPSAAAKDPSAALATTAARSGVDGPAGFWYGSDSWPIPVTGSEPYRNPGIGGSYGGYIGMAGNWARWQGCQTGNFLAWSAANAKQADTNYTSYRKGIGTAVYWYMGGPGVDPHWNGTAAEASAWGAEQATQALADAVSDHATYPVLFMDIELPGVKPALDNGWNDVYTAPCSGVTRQGHVTAAIARAEFNGFAGYLTAHSHYKAGVYSQPAIWAQIFGTGSAAYIPHIYEWTYEPETADLSDAPHGWCLKASTGTCAEFFGGVSTSSPYAVMWQWSGGGGVRNALGDFDQINTSSQG
jgi:hypothetical protein